MSSNSGAAPVLIQKCTYVFIIILWSSESSWRHLFVCLFVAESSVWLGDYGFTWFYRRWLNSTSTQTLNGRVENYIYPIILVILSLVYSTHFYGSTESWNRFFESTDRRCFRSPFVSGNSVGSASEHDSDDEDEGLIFLSKIVIFPGKACIFSAHPCTYHPCVDLSSFSLMFGVEATRTPAATNKDFAKRTGGDWTVRAWGE